MGHNVFGHFVIPERSWQVTLKYCGFENCDPGFFVPPHVRNEYLIHYIIRGKGSFTCEETSFPLKPHDLFLIRPGQIVSYRTEPEDPFQFCWFAFQTENANQLVSLIGFSPAVPVRPLHAQFSIVDDIQTLIMECEKDKHHNEFKIQSLLYEIISKLRDSYCRFSGLSENTNGSPRKKYISSAKEFIKLNYMRDISVQDVATHVRLNRSYFSKLFKDETDITAQQYILKIRLSQSKILLEKNNYSIKEICFFVGLKDPYYFSRIFKQSFGITPSQYRCNVIPVQ